MASQPEGKPGSTEKVDAKHQKQMEERRQEIREEAEGDESPHRTRKATASTDEEKQAQSESMTRHAGVSPDPNQPKPANTETSPNKQGFTGVDRPEHKPTAATERRAIGEQQPVKSTAQIERDRGLIPGGSDAEIEAAKAKSGHAPEPPTGKLRGEVLHPGDGEKHPSEADESFVDPNSPRKRV